MAWFYKLQEHMDTILDYKTIWLHNVVLTECTNRWKMEDEVMLEERSIVFLFM